MIDAHIHVVPPRLPGVGSLSPILEGRPEAVGLALRREMAEAGITHALAMGCLSQAPDDPLGIDDTLLIAAHVPGLHAIGAANPTLSDRPFLRRVEADLTAGKVVALKGYLGY